MIITTFVRPYLALSMIEVGRMKFLYLDGRINTGRLELNIAWHDELWLPLSIVAILLQVRLLNHLDLVNGKGHMFT